MATIGVAGTIITVGVADGTIGTETIGTETTGVGTAGTAIIGAGEAAGTDGMVTIGAGVAAGMVGMATIGVMATIGAETLTPTAVITATVMPTELADETLEAIMVTIAITTTQAEVATATEPMPSITADDLTLLPDLQQTKRELGRYEITIQA